MRTERDDDHLLQPFFDAARATAPEPGAGLMARIAADAAAEAPRPAAAAAAPVRAPAPRRRNRLAELVAVLGGWAGIGGLATAALAGVWIGVALPGPLAALDGAFQGTGAAADNVELIPDLVAFLTEG